MHEYLLYDREGDEYTYEASDLRMALTVHHQVVGTEVLRAEII